jgi:hypothetical protein
MKSIIWSGYGFSGGGALRDILQEFEFGVRFPGEFRLIKEKFGLFDLEDAIFNSIDPEKIDLAIKDFEWLCEKYSKKDGRFRSSGLGYNYKTGGQFLNLSNNFISKISDYQYPMSWHFYDFKKSYSHVMFDRVINKFHKKPWKTYQKAHMSYPKHEVFIDAARNYIEMILESFMVAQHKDKESTILLSKALPAYSMELLSRGVNYFKNAKVIVIDRDPRDVFTDLLKNGKKRYLLNSNDIVEQAVEFVKFFKAIRINQHQIKEDDGFLFIKFEDLIYNYEKSLNLLYEFLEIQPIDHKAKGCFFNPELSSKNTLLWKDFQGKNMQAIEVIKEELPEYLYQFDQELLK